MKSSGDHEASVARMKRALVGVMIFDALLMLYAGIAVSYLWVMNEWYGESRMEDVLRPPHLLLGYFRTIIGEYVLPHFNELKAGFLAMVFLPPLAGLIVAATSTLAMWRIIIPRMENQLRQNHDVAAEPSSVQETTERTDTTAL